MGDLHTLIAEICEAGWRLQISTEYPGGPAPLYMVRLVKTSRDSEGVAQLWQLTEMDVLLWGALFSAARRCHDPLPEPLKAQKPEEGRAKDPLGECEAEINRLSEDNAALLKLVTDALYIFDPPNDAWTKAAIYNATEEWLDAVAERGITVDEDAVEDD